MKTKRKDIPSGKADIKPNTFALVQFANNKYSIYPLKKIVMVNEVQCIVKHGGTYEANIVSVNDKKEELEKQKESLQTSSSLIALNSQLQVGPLLKKYSPSDSNNCGNCIEDFMVHPSISTVNDINYNTSENRIDEFTVHPSTSTVNYNNCNTSQNDTEEFIVHSTISTVNGIEETNNSSMFKDFSIGSDLIDLSSTNTSVTFNEGLFRDSGELKEPTTFSENLEFNETAESPDDSVVDPNYEPKLDSSDDAQSNNMARQGTQFQETETSCFNISDLHNSEINNSVNISPFKGHDSLKDISNTSPENTKCRYSDILNAPGVPICDDNTMFVAPSRGKKGDKKANFCFYCHSKQQKIARHLETQHREEEDVKKFLRLPKQNSERRSLIADIRKKGNFIFNTNQHFNDGELIVSRRPQSTQNKLASCFKACANWKAFFAKRSLRTHFSKCTGQKSSTRRIIMTLSKKVTGRLHAKASDTVRKFLFPPLREDHIVMAIRYDELLIVFANKMCDKYRDHRHHEMIRQRLRLLGRFFCTLRKINTDISDFSSIYDPKYCDDILKSINIEARFNSVTCSFEAPTVASMLGTLLKQVGNIYIIECIKNHLEEKRKNAKHFLKLLVQELNININRTVAESQLAIKRQQKTELPSREDIKKLHFYLHKCRVNAIKNLKEKFSVTEWTKLAETTLLGIQLFNRRRPGEVERITIQDFKNYETVDQHTNKDLFDMLSVESREIARKYVRFTIRGKLNRTVPVLLHSDLLESVKLLIQNRNKMKVPTENPYVFGIYKLNTNGYKYLRACALMRKYSEICGATYPERLRATKLRKHIATICISLNLEEQEVSDVANFMGHGDRIHKNIYRQPIAGREILRMSKILENAQGGDLDCSDDEIEMDEEIEMEKGNEHASSAPKKQTKSSTVCTPAKRSISPYGSVKRVRWTEEEKSVIYTNFSEHLRRRTLPSLKDIQTVIKENPELTNRTSPQVKTWISNQFKSRRTGDTP